MRSRSLPIVAACVAATVLLTACANDNKGSSSDKFPTKTIQAIIPAAPGGSADVVARELEAAWEKELGQKIEVVNKPGGGMVVGAVAAAHATPDCYTIVYHIFPNILLGNLTTKNVEYNPNDFYALGTITDEAPVIRVRNDGPFKTLTDFINYAKANPNKLTVAVPPQSGYYLSALYFEKATGVQLKLVTYGGADSRLAIEKKETMGLVGGVFDTQSVKGDTHVLAVLADSNTWPSLTNNAPTATEAAGTTVEGFPSRIMALVPKGCQASNPTRYAFLEKTFLAAAKSDAFLQVLTKLGSQSSLDIQDGPATNAFLQQQLPAIQQLVAEYPALSASS